MNKVTLRDLRNDCRQVIERVARGELLVITKDGVPVAELRPVSKTGVSAEVLLERYRSLPAVDERQWQHDVDAVFPQSV